MPQDAECSKSKNCDALILSSVISMGREHSQDVETSGRIKSFGQLPYFLYLGGSKGESGDCMVRSERRSAAPRREIMRQLGNYIV